MKRERPGPFQKYRGTGFAGPLVLPLQGLKARGSKPACAGLDGLKSRSLWQRLVLAQRHEVREAWG